MIPFTKQGTPVVTLAVPADNAVETTLTQSSATAIVANDYESLVVDLLAKDDETGAKSVVVTLWGKATADGTVGDGTWTAITSLPTLEGAALTRTLAASAAVAASVTRTKVAMRDVPHKYVAAKAVVTHPDPTATPDTVYALIVTGEIARRDV